MLLWFILPASSQLSAHMKKKIGIYLCHFWSLSGFLLVYVFTFCLDFFGRLDTWIITILISSDLHSSGFKMCNNGVVFILAFQVFKDVQNFGVKSLKSVGKEVLSLPSSAPDTRLWLYTPSFLTFSFCPSWWLLPNLYLQLRPLSWFPHNQLSLVTQLSPDRSESACVTLELRPVSHLHPPSQVNKKVNESFSFSSVLLVNDAVLLVGQSDYSCFHQKPSQ